MRLLLVRPRPDPETIGLQHVMLVEPLDLEVLATAAGPDVQTTIVDLVLESGSLRSFLRRYQPDVLGVTGYITNVPTMIEYCREAKRFDPAVTTVLGGVHCEVCPHDLDDPAVDFRVVRNGAIAFPALLEHVRGRGPCPAEAFGPGEAVAPAELPPFDYSFPIPDRDLTQRYRHQYFYIFHDKVALMKTAFGCPFSCTFCFCRAITGGAYHERPLDEVLTELASIREREIYIVDDDFLVSRKRVSAFIEGVRAEGIDKHYLLYGRADFVARHPDLMAEFQAVGLRTVIVGFESFDDAELDRYAKGTDAAANTEAMAVLNRLGIDCYATIILSPDWGDSQFAALGKQMRRLGIQFVNLQPLTPLPGTGFEVPDDDLVIPRDDFARWDLAHVSIRPQQMSVSQYYGKIIEGYTSTLYQPRVLAGYLKYPPQMLWKMVRGNRKVYQQYQRKMKEARRLD